MMATRGRREKTKICRSFAPQFHAALICFCLLSVSGTCVYQHLVSSRLVSGKKMRKRLGACHAQAASKALVFACWVPLSSIGLILPKLRRGVIKQSANERYSPDLSPSSQPVYSADLTVQRSDSGNGPMLLCMLLSVPALQ